ncbi:MAG: hypothetical protein ACRD3G_08665 [Vicinamibacterales bacterium]
MASTDLSLRPAGEGADVRQIFRGHATTSRTRVLSGTVVHVLAVAALLLAARLVPERVISAELLERMPVDLVYITDPGTGGGGGGGDRSSRTSMLIRTIVWLLVLLLTTGQSATLLASDYFGQVTFNGLPVPGATVTATKGETKASATTDGRAFTTWPPLRTGSGRSRSSCSASTPSRVRLRSRRKTNRRRMRLSVRSYDELTRALPPARAFEPRDSEDEEPINITVLTGPAGMGAADGLLINGSLTC